MKLTFSNPEAHVRQMTPAAVRRRILYGLLLFILAITIRVGVDLIYDAPGGALVAARTDTP